MKADTIPRSEQAPAPGSAAEPLSGQSGRIAAAPTPIPLWFHPIQTREGFFDFVKLFLKNLKRQIVFSLDTVTRKSS